MKNKNHNSYIGVATGEYPGVSLVINNKLSYANFVLFSRKDFQSALDSLQSILDASNVSDCVHKIHVCFDTNIESSDDVKKWKEFFSNFSSVEYFFFDDLVQMKKEPPEDYRKMSSEALQKHLMSYAESEEQKEFLYYRGFAYSLYLAEVCKNIAHLSEAKIQF